jgi:nitroreductase
METLEAIHTRYACRAYDGSPIPIKTLRDIARAGLAAPSAMNLQPWRLVIVSEKKLIEELDAIGMAQLEAGNPAAHQRMMDRGGTLFYNASAIIFVLKSTAELGFSPELDCGIVTANLVLAARDLGVDSVICGFARILFSGDRGSELQERLRFPEGFDFAASVLLGYASGPAGTPHQPDTSKIIEV